MLTLTSPVDTPLHHLPAGAKLFALCLFTVVIFALATPLPLLGALALVGVLHMPGRKAFAVAGVRLLWPLWPFVAIVGLWHAITDDAQGGTVVILRMVTAVAAANLVTMTTRLSDMMAVIERLARPLSPVLPPRVLALAIALVIRFVPVLSQRAAQIGEAWRARSAQRPGRHILVPMTLAALDDAEHVAEALRARGGAR